MLAGLLQAWSYAAETNVESLLSAIPAQFALLFRIISSDLSFRDYGLRLGRTLLQQSHAKLIAKGLSASQTKEHLISPCLRLLVELATFDGGSLAKQLYLVQQFTLDPQTLARNLTRWKTLPADPEEARRKPSVRTNAVRYLLATLKFQSTPAKVELLKNTTVFRAMFEYMRHDPFDLLKDIFQIVRVSLLAEPKVPRQSKAHILHERNLSNLALLYDTSRVDEADANAGEVAKAAHAFLKYVCTSPEAGLLKASGWYPPGTEKSTENFRSEDGSLGIDLGLYSIEWYHKFQSKVPVRNVALANFTQGLRPYASVLESELLVEIFQAAPELVAHYFIEKTSFAFDPKLTATWIGYSAFLFSVVSTPAPNLLGTDTQYPRVPPPVSVVVESILPTPLSKKVLTRCLNQQTDLITFFAIRVLGVAFQKLQTCLARFRQASREAGSLWDEASTLLLEEFTQRCPDVKDIIATWRKTPQGNQLQREASLRLLKLCYQVTPQNALLEKFDISAALGEALDAFIAPDRDVDMDQTDESTTLKNNLPLLQLSHLLQIARWTPDIRWFGKSSGDKLSPCAALILILTSQEASHAPVEMRDLLAAVLRDHGVLQEATGPKAVEALLTSLQPALAHHREVLFFLDDAMDRTVKRPMKYQDDLDELPEKDGEPRPLSLLWMTLLEQWPYAAAQDEAKALDIARWLIRYQHDSVFIREDDHHLASILSRLREATMASNLTAALTAPTADLSAHIIHAKEQLFNNDAGRHPNPTSQSTSPSLTFTVPNSLGPLAPSASALHTWRSHPDIPSAIHAGVLPPLISCLASPYPEVQHQAYLNLRIIHDALAPSATPSVAFSDAKQFYLFLGELLTTIGPLFTTPDPATPISIPGILIAYATLAVPVLLDPLHPLYDKINAFHTRAPTWPTRTLAAYWTSRLLHVPASDPAAYTPGANATAASKRAERAFLLALLERSLQRRADVDTSLRRHGGLEAILALVSAGPGRGRGREADELREGVCRIVWRVAMLDEGATMVTRAGVLGWIAVVLALMGRGGGRASTARADAKDRGRGDAEAAKLCTEAGLRGLARYIWERCDRAQLARWDGGVQVEEAGVRELMGDVELVGLDGRDGDEAAEEPM